ncbi:hypothetical protein ACJX0J_011083 [Zea mays]
MKQGPNRDISLILEMVTLPRDDKTKSKTFENDGDGNELENQTSQIYTDVAIWDLGTGPLKICFVIYAINFCHTLIFFIILHCHNIAKNNVFANVRSSPSSNGFILIPIFLEQTLGFGSVHVSINSRIKVVKLLRRLHGESTQDKAIWTINKKDFLVEALWIGVLVACHKE